MNVFDFMAGAIVVAAVLIILVASFSFHWMFGILVAILLFGS